MTTPKDEIKKRISVLQLLDDLAIEHRGVGQNIRCPWHDDAEPSCTIYEDHLFCHGGCGRKDAFDLWQVVHGSGFREALVALAGKTGVDLGGGQPADDAFAAFCQERRLRSELLLSVWRGAVRLHRQRKGARTRPALIVPTALGVDRVRYLDGAQGDEPKTSWRTRGGRAHWYGLDQAKEVLGRDGTPKVLYIVNGEPSVWACHQGGVAAVCTCAGEDGGTPRDADVLAGLGAPVRIVYDLDETGRRGAGKLLDALRRCGKFDDVAALALPDDLGDKGDVDDLHRKVGDEGLAQALAALPGVAPPRPAEEATTRPTQEPPRSPARGEPHDDIGNGQRLVRRHGDRFRYCAALGGYVSWSGSSWLPGGQAGRADVEKWAHETVRRIADEARGLRGDDFGRVMEWARTSASAHKVRAMIECARPYVTEPASVFDQADDLLNLPNGTYDLRRHEFGEHRRDDLITQSTVVPYDPRADAPLWLRCISDWFRGDADTIAYVKKLVGISLWPTAEEHVLVLFFGPGRNGKSTFLNTLRWMLGDYAQTADFSTLTARDPKDHGPRDDLAALRAARFVVAIEAERHVRLSEKTVNAATGGDEITCAAKYGHTFSYTPKFKLWLAVNALPKAPAEGEGFWARIKRVDFRPTIPKGERDPQLKEKLKAEGPGILNWALAGLRAYQQDGLGDCPAVEAATARYRADNDAFSRFFRGGCLQIPDAKSTPDELLAAQNCWAAQFQEEAMTKRAIGLRLKALGFERNRDGSSRHWIGIGIRNVLVDGTEDAEDAEDEVVAHETGDEDVDGVVTDESDLQVGDDAMTQDDAIPGSFPYARAIEKVSGNSRHLASCVTTSTPAQPNPEDAQTSVPESVASATSAGAGGLGVPESSGLDVPFADVSRPDQTVLDDGWELF